MTPDSASPRTLRVGPDDDPDRYEIGAAVGSGAEGILYRGSITTQAGTRLPVAIKMLQPRFLSRVAEWQSRWGEQVELLRSLQIPGVVTVRDGFLGPLPHTAGSPGEGKTLYLIMNWVDGESLDDWVRHNPDRDPIDSLKLLIPIAAALDLMHSGRQTGGVPVIHRDVKPSNILVSADGSVLVDFGLIRGLPFGEAQSSVVGTPGYLAPETRSEGRWVPASDGYALGLVAFFILTGVEPAQTTTTNEIAEILTEIPQLSDRQDVVLRLLAMLHPEPLSRPSALANWIGQLRDSSLPETDEGSAPQAPSRPVAEPNRNGTPRVIRRLRRPVPLLSALVAVVTTVAMFAFVGSTGSRPRPPTLGASFQRPPAQPNGLTTATTLPSIPPTAVAGNSSATSPVLQSGHAAAIAATTPCGNKWIGYQISIPAGVYSSPDSPTLGACQVLAWSPLPPGSGLTQGVITAPVAFYQLSGLVTSIQSGTASPYQYVNSPARTVAVGTSHRSALVIESVLSNGDSLFPAGSRMYTYLVPLTFVTLVASLVDPPSESSTVYAQHKHLLDEIMASLDLWAPACQNSIQPYCGEFYWRTVPAQNQPMQAKISVSPPNPQVGQQVTFTITASDPDASVISLVQSSFGDEVVPQDVGQSSTVGFLPEVRGQTSASPGQAFGPWNPPLSVPGSRTLTVTHTYTSGGTYQVGFILQSSCPQAPPAHDPYASIDDSTATVTVSQP